jgi:anti-anti-sigma regulatory factor
VVFSFFKKDKAPSPPKPAGQAASGITRQGGPATQMIDAGPKTSLRSGIEVVETGASLSASVEEAAVLYASGHTDQAITALSHTLRENPDADDVEPWLMLFDLYRVAEDQSGFEELALDFAVRFERSPPAWAVSKAGPSAGGTSVGAGNRFALPAHMDDILDLDGLYASTAGGSLRLDLGKVETITAAAAVQLHEALEAARKNGVRIHPAGVGYFVAVLAEARQASPSEAAFWLLGLDILQLAGNQEEFENMAVDYAVQFEVSPPSWESLATPVIEERRAPPEPAAQPAASDSFALSGVIDASAQPQLEALQEFASGRSDVEIDMSAVTRVDFATVGMFMNCLIEIGQGGRRVLIRDALEPVNALMRIMGIDQLATLVGKTR